MTPEEEAKHKAWSAKVDWENSCLKSPLHTILPADPGTFMLWPNWPAIPHRERVIAWDINTADIGWRWPITLSGVECETGHPVLFPDGTISETGYDGTSWVSMEDFICSEMKAWSDKRVARAKT